MSPNPLTKAADQAEYRLIDFRDKEYRMIADYKDGNWDEKGSTSEQITLALAVGDDSFLPKGYREFDDAWARLDARQQRIVREYWGRPWTVQGSSIQAPGVLEPVSEAT